MYAITEQVKKAILDRRAQRLKLTISNAEKVITVSEANVQSGGFSIDRHSTSSNKLALGSASAADLELSLANLNGEFDDFKFEGAEIRPEVIIDSNPYYIMRANGKSLTLENTEDTPLNSLKIYGKTTQNGAPTPDNPIPLENVGVANLLNPINVIAGSNTTIIDGVVTQKTADTNNSPIFKCLTYNGNTLVKLTNSANRVTNVGRIGATFEKTSDVNRLVFGLNGSSIDTIVSVNVSYLPKGTYFVSVDFTNVTQGSVSWKDMMINEGTTARAYRPYNNGQECVLTDVEGENAAPQQLITSTPNGLCGLPVSSGGNYTDKAGQQWICDEVDFERGVLVKRTKKITFNGTETNWEKYHNDVAAVNNGFRIRLSDVRDIPGWVDLNTTIISNQLIWGGYIGIYAKTSVGLSEAQYLYLRFDDSAPPATTVEGLISFLASSPLTVLYELNTPTEIPLSAEEIAQYKALHTLEGTTLVDSDGEMDIEYLVSDERDGAAGEKTFSYVIPQGYFTVDNQPRKLSTIKITALDRMVLFDKTVDWSILSFPMSASSLVTQICNICNVNLYENPTSLINSGYTVEKPSINGDITYRQLLMYCAEILACCAFIDENGLLRLSWYSQTEDDTIDITERYSSDINENDITISGVVITYDDVEYIAGSTDYAILLQSNPLITHDVQEVAENIYSAIKGTTYRPYECSSMPLPYLYPLDCISLIDEDENKIKTLVTHVNFTLNNALSLKGVGETSQNNGYATVNPLTMQESAIIERLRGEMNKTLNDRIQAIIGFNELISNSMGLYSTTVVKENGSRQTFMHDAPTLEQSMTIYTLTEGGFAYTNSGWNGGNPSYEYGFDKFGNAIFNKVCAYGIEVSDPNTKYSAKITPEAFETYFGAMPTSSFNGEMSEVRKMKILESFQTGKSLLVPHYEEDELTGKPKLIGTDLVFLEEE